MMMTHVIANVIPSYYTGVSSSLSLSLSFLWLTHFPFGKLQKHPPLT
jgi:hypothetical protein